MDPDEIVRPEQRREGVRESCIHTPIGGQVPAGKVHKIEPIVEQRTQRSIGKPL